MLIFFNRVVVTKVTPQINRHNKTALYTTTVSQKERFGAVRLRSPFVCQLKKG